jgi:hypothetical protein
LDFAEKLKILNKNYNIFGFDLEKKKVLNKNDEK